MRPHPRSACGKSARGILVSFTFCGRGAAARGV